MPIERPAVQNQLTVIDASSMAQEDFQEYCFAPRKESGYAAIPTWNPDHRFYCVSNMRPGGVLVFKQCDFRPRRPKACPHVLRSVSVGKHHAGRRCVEYRALRVF